VSEETQTPGGNSTVFGFGEMSD